MRDPTTLSRPFERLREGDELTTHGRTVTEADVVAFSALTGDLHPQHVDAAWAASTAVGERIAPGLLTLSYAAGLMRASASCAIALRALHDVVFTRPVTIGDTISVHGRVTALGPVQGEAGIVSLSLTTSNQRQKTVCRARAQVLWRRELSDEPAEAAEAGP